MKLKLTRAVSIVGSTVISQFRQGPLHAPKSTTWYISGDVQMPFVRNSVVRISPGNIDLCVIAGTGECDPCFVRMLSWYPSTSMSDTVNWCGLLSMAEVIDTEGNDIHFGRRVNFTSQNL